MFESGESIEFTFKKNRWTIRFTVEPRDLKGRRVAGIIIPGRREIDIQAGLSSRQTVEAVVHELLHLCGWRGDKLSEVGMPIQEVGESQEKYEFWITQTARVVAVVLNKLELTGERHGTHIRNTA